MTQMIRATTLLLVAALLSGCGKGEAPVTVDEAPSVETESTSSATSGAKSGAIDWFDGSVEEAFAEAERSGKPIFLYWGAEWCPPCHAINATIFNRPEFIERSKLFVPVYLDGDTADAQSQGEYFGVRGYPTMIVFDAAGEELTRIPGGIDLLAYANILDLTLDQTSSAGELVAAIREGTGTVAPDQCTLLAYYSWGQDTQILSEHEREDAFRSMYDACPADQAKERSILYLAWLTEVINVLEADAEDTEAPAQLASELKQEAVVQIGATLADDELAKASVLTLLFSGATITRHITEEGSDERADLTRRFTDVYDRFAADESIYKRERIYTLRGKLRFERIDDSEAEVSDELKQEIAQMVEWADASTPSDFERQPIINALGNVLADANMDELARPLLVAELERSKQPYYFMVSLAEIEQRAGNFDAAMDWLKQAHDASTGPATRFQWGYYYLSGLIDMKPEEADLIRETTVSLIDELQKGGGFFQRPKAQLKRLEGRLRTWGEEHDKVTELDGIRSTVLQLCAADTRSDSRAICEDFLGPV